MPEILLPAYPVTLHLGAPNLVGGDGALADGDPATFIEIGYADSFRVGTGVPGTGFDLADVPEGATILAVEWVATCYTTGREAAPDGLYFSDPDAGSPEVQWTPALLMDYDNPSYLPVLDDLPLTLTEVATPMPDWQYVVADLAPEDFLGLSPQISLGSDFVDPHPYVVRITEMALRVTYTLGLPPVPPLVLWPRRDGKTTVKALWPPPIPRQQ